MHETVQTSDAAAARARRVSDRGEHPAMLGRLNIFQESMLHWTDFHPYNAVHLIRIPEVLDRPRLRSAINGTLEALGLTNLELNRERGTYRYHGGPAGCEIRDISGSLQAEIEQQLNTGFARNGRCNPFRFFVEAGEKSFSLGLVYFHPVADAEAIVRLMKRIVEAYAAGSEPTADDRPNLHPRRHDRFFAQRPRLLAHKLAALSSTFWNMRRSCRPRYREPGDFRNGLLAFSLPPGQVRLLLDTSRMLEVTLHDLFLALLMKALSPLAAHRRRSRQRRKISVGSIVNIRGDLGPEQAEAFGLCLGSFVVTHEVPELLHVKTLAREIRQQTIKIKQQKLYLGAPLELILARLALALFSAERKTKFYQKNYPLWGGITNLNLNLLWKHEGGAAPPDYFRAVSTGPVTPLVLSITTVGDSLNAGITYRSTVFGAAEIGQIKQGLLEGIDSLVSDG